MIVQMSKNVILVRSKRWRVRWQVFVYKDTWQPLTERLGTDDMHRQLIAMGFPMGDIALFVEAVNHPERVPFNPGLRKEPIPIHKPNPVGLFHPEAREA